MENSLAKIKVKTNKNRETIDITDQINKLLQNQEIERGFCHLFVKSVNTALTTALLDPEEDLAVASILEIITPELTAPEASEYHRHITPVASHVVASFLGPFLSLPFEGKRLVLGEDQRLILVELSGPRKHEIIVDCS